MTGPRIRLITRGDDCGSNHTANVAIMEACQKGMLRNVSMMIPCAAIEEAAEMFAGEVSICCGLHTTMNAEWDRVKWGPVLPPGKVPSLVDARGHFFRTPPILGENSPRLDEAMAEIQAQLDRGRELGFDFKYVDSHMGFGRAIPGFVAAFDAWCDQEGLLNHSFYQQRLPSFEAKGDPVEQLISRLDAAAPGQYLLVGHPAYDTEEMYLLGFEGLAGETIAAEREWQRQWFMDPRVLDYCRKNGVVAVRYDEAERLRN